MHILFPCDPFDRKLADEPYREEFLAFRAAGIPCILFSAEDFESGEFAPRPAIRSGEEIVYRGWMLTPDDYAGLHAAIAAQGGKPLTSPGQYRHCHYLPEWYATCADLTPQTVVLGRNADFRQALAVQGWTGCFVKDYVKSLTTSRGSIASNAEEVAEVISLIEKFRGRIEGGICLRQIEDLLPESEERYFVYRQRAFGRDGAVPEIVHAVAARIPSPFFSVDVVMRRDGTLRLIELGDGQVSDRKQWPAGRFAEIFQSD